MQNNYYNVINILKSKESITDQEYKILALLIEHHQDSAEKKYETNLLQTIAKYLGELFSEKFTLQDYFSSGGFAHTTTVKSKGNDRTYIMKHLHYNKTFIEEHKERFIREILNTLSIEHNNIPSVIYFGKSHLHEDEEEYYYIMDYIDGKDFYSHIFENENNTDWKNQQYSLLSTYGDILSAMAFLHSKNIYHRDCILPNMIYNETKKKSYLIDLGLSKKSDDSIPITKPNTSQGNPAYIAPESISQGIYSQLTDIYTLGASLYSLITQRYPHDFFATDMDSACERIRKWIFETQTPLELTKEQNTPYYHFNSIITKATAFYPHERYKTIDAFLKDYTLALQKL